MPGERLEIAPLIGFDRAGNLYVASAVERQSTDVAVRQFSPGLALRYTTYIGGRGYDVPTAIAVGADGAVIVGLGTRSEDLAVVNPIQREPGGGFDGGVAPTDAAFARLTPAGAIAQLSYLSGGGSERITAAAFDTDGSAFLTGFTSSPNFPVRNALPPPAVRNWIGFVTKITPAGALDWSTLFGGGRTQPGSLVIHQGAAVIGGTTWARDFPTTDVAWGRFPVAGRNGFVIKIGPGLFGGLRVHFATLLRVSAAPYGPFDQQTPESEVTAVGVDSRGAVYLAGWTDARDFGDRSAANPCGGNQYPVIWQWSTNVPSGVVAKLDPSGSRAEFAACLSDVRPSAMYLDRDGGVILAGPSQFAGRKPFRPGCSAETGALMKFAAGEAEPIATFCVPQTAGISIASSPAGATYLAGLSERVSSITRVTVCGPVRAASAPLEFPPTGLQASLAIMAPAGCAWEIRPVNGWLRVLSGSSGTGPGSAIVEADSAAEGFRAGTLLAGGSAITVVQHDGAKPVIEVFEPSAVLVAAGGIVELSWSTRFATSVRISGLGEVAPAAMVRRYVYEDTEYQIDATGPGGSASARVKVFTTAPNGGQTAALNSPRVRKPAPGEVVEAYPVVFDWIDGVVRGSLEQPPRLTIRTPPNRIVEMVGPESQWLVPLPGGDYSATLARCNDQTCFYNVDWNFSVRLRPFAPVTGLSADGQRLSWRGVADAARYEIETVRDDGEIRLTSAASSPFLHELPSGRYRARVRPCHIACGEWTEPVEFGVDPAEVIDTAPVLRGTGFSEWDPVAGAAWYRYTLWEAGAAVASWRANARVPPGARPNAFEISVAACNTAGCGPESNRVAGTPGAPGLPFVTETGASLSWTEVTGASSYRVTVTDVAAQERVFDRNLSGRTTPLFLRGGRRYRAAITATVIVRVGLGSQVRTYAGPAVEFDLDGGEPAAPTPASATRTGSSFSVADVKVTVSAATGATSYQTRARRVSDGGLVQMVMSPTPTLFHRILAGTPVRIAARACMVESCLADSDEGWTPWSTDAGIPDLLFP